MKKLFLITGFIFLFAQCKKDKNEESSQDTELYNESGSANGFTYYKNSTTLLASSSESPHGAYMRGVSCTSCHSGTGNIDNVRVFSLFL